MIKKAVNSLLYAVFPKRCKLCGEVIRLDSTLCPECENAEKISGDICFKCGREKDCCVCKEEKFSPDYKAIAAPYYYEGSIEKGINRMKNNGFSELAQGMSKEIAETVNNRFSDITFDYVTSVPMRKRKEKTRGYNQSEFLAKALAKRIKTPYRPLLKKIADTPSQRYSSVSARHTNLYGAFDLADGAKVDGKTVLIVDDVKTTGSTLSECAAMLKIYGATVYATAFAVTNKHENKK